MRQFSSPFNKLSVPAVAVSAAARPGDVELLYGLGVAHFVEKGPEFRPRITEITKELYALMEAGAGGT